MKLTEIFQVLIITGVMSLVANTVGTKNDLMQAIPGMGILIAIAFIGMWMGRVLPGKIPGKAVSSVSYLNFKASTGFGSFVQPVFERQYHVSTHHI